MQLCKIPKFPHAPCWLVPRSPLLALQLFLALYLVPLSFLSLLYLFLFLSFPLSISQSQDILKGTAKKVSYCHYSTTNGKIEHKHTLDSNNNKKVSHCNTKKQIARCIPHPLLSSRWCGNLALRFLCMGLISLCVASE